MSLLIDSIYFSIYIRIYQTLNYTFFSEKLKPSILSNLIAIKIFFSVCFKWVLLLNTVLFICFSIVSTTFFFLIFALYVKRIYFMSCFSHLLNSIPIHYVT